MTMMCVSYIAAIAARFYEWMMNDDAKFYKIYIVYCIMLIIVLYCLALCYVTAKPLLPLPNVLTTMYIRLERARLPFRRVLERERTTHRARDLAHAAAQEWIILFGWRIHSISRARAAQEHILWYCSCICLSLRNIFHSFIHSSMTDHIT